jgi:hypothetical protein
VARVAIATVDALHGDVVREALSAAGIDARIVPVTPFKQLAYFRHQRPPQVDVEVEGAEAEAARGVMAHLEREMAEAIRAEADFDEGAKKSTDDLRIESEQGARRTPSQRRSPLIAFLLALVVPVAGPAYWRSPQRSAWFVCACLSLMGHAAAIYLIFWPPLRAIPGSQFMPDDTPRQFGMGLLVVARIFDIIVSPALALDEESHGARS